MKIIGLCGKSASGKGLFSQIARREGFTVIDCDKVYKDLVSNPSRCLSEIEDHFGAESVVNGRLNRPYVGKIVFSDKEKLSLLNSITHKYIIAETEKIISSLPCDTFVIIDAPTLFESGINEKCHIIVGIVATDELCVQRIVSRDNITEAAAKARLDNQKTTEFIIEHSDVIIYNDSDIPNFEDACVNVLRSVKEGIL